MKKENNVKKMRWNMKNPDSLKWYFLIGALIGAVLFVLIYGFSVLNVTNDAWLMTGKDLQQHYIGFGRINCTVLWEVCSLSFLHLYCSVCLDC